MSKNPVSSRKARWAPSFLAFFYMRPNPALPARDLPLVPFQSPTFWFLAAPAHLVAKKFPDAYGGIAHPVTLPNQTGNPFQGPRFCGVSSRHGAFQ
jgi:hypothetical protein